LDLGSCGARRRIMATAALVTSAWIFVTAMPPAHAGTTAAGKVPNLVTGSAYLVAPANLIAGHYYESFPGTADFGLTIDGALALAATGDEDQALRKIVAFIDHDGKDPSGGTVNDWTGIGTSYASGGAIGKEALLAEVVGDNPRSFGGHNLIAALDTSVCKRASTGGNTSCPAAGSYLNDTSMFDQALGIMAQLRAGQTGDAAAPIAYLETLQSAHGSWPSLIPPSGGPDVDSTAMAVMALALVPGSHARADVLAGLAWIASKQERNGGFPSAGAESINSTGLAIQALTLRASAYKGRISAALKFLAREQNSNGGFDADAGQRGSNLRASTQAVGGAVGTSFGTLRRKLSPPRAKARHHSGRPSQHDSGRPGDAGAAKHGAKSHASAKPTASSAGTASRHPRRPASQTPLRGNRATDASAALTSMPTFGILPTVIAGILALIVGLLLSWRRPRRSAAEAKQAPTAPRDGS
jgi:hypothetical protein